MVEWAKRFDIPVYLHEADRRWVMRPSERIVTHDAHQAVLRSADRYIRALGAVPR